MITSDSFLPKNTIIIITGSTCPNGWELCNGSNGTPDLRGKSPFGINGGYSNGVNVNFGDSSGAITHNHTDLHVHDAETILYHDNTIGSAEAGSTTRAYYHNHNVVLTTNESSSGQTEESSNVMGYYAVNYCLKVVD